MNKILIVMPDKHLGNFVIALNAIVPLRKFYGQENVAVVLDETHREITEVMLGLKNIIFYPRKQLESSQPLLKRCCAYVQFMREVRQFKPDISAALEGDNVSAVINYLSGAKKRLGGKIHHRTNAHRLDSYLDIMMMLDLPKPTSLIQLTAPEQTYQSVQKILTEYAISLEKPLICFHTGAGKPHKQWPIENFTALAEQLSATAHYQVVLIGGNAERQQNDFLIQHCSQKIHNLTGCFSPLQLIALFKQTALLISNDSGPMHIAALSGTPVIALFGPTDTTVWRPLSEKAIVLKGEEDFSSLTVDKVMTAVQQYRLIMLPAAADSGRLNHS